MHITPTELKNTSGTYRISFTAGGLLLAESLVIAKLQQTHESWEQLIEYAITENVLKTRTESTSKRLVREICLRLRHLHEDEYNLLIYGTPIDQRLLLWISVCRTYAFVGDFALEVVREKHFGLSRTIELQDYEYFYTKKSEYHQELTEITSNTKNKLRQVLFRMLREAGILTKANEIVEVFLSTSLLHIAQKHKTEFYPYIPITQN